MPWIPITPHDVFTAEVGAALIAVTPSARASSRFSTPRHIVAVARDPARSDAPRARGCSSSCSSRPIMAFENDKAHVDLAEPSAWHEGTVSLLPRVGDNSDLRLEII